MINRRAFWNVRSLIQRGQNKYVQMSIRPHHAKNKDIISPRCLLIHRIYLAVIISCSQC